MQYNLPPNYQENKNERRNFTNWIGLVTIMDTVTVMVTVTVMDTVTVTITVMGTIMGTVTVRGTVTVTVTVAQTGMASMPLRPRPSTGIIWIENENGLATVPYNNTGAPAGRGF